MESTSIEVEFRKSSFPLSDLQVYQFGLYLKQLKAWNSYINQQLIDDPDPPTWFYKEFLVPLGFDRMVMDIPEVQ